MRNERSRLDGLKIRNFGCETRIGDMSGQFWNRIR